MHGGILWMERPIPINVDLIIEITWLPIDGEKLDKYLDDKTRVKAIFDENKVKYDTERGNKGIGINEINDPANQFAARSLGYKLMHKCQKEEVSIGVVGATS
jgi:hypothetical protein